MIFHLKFFLPFNSLVTNIKPLFIDDNAYSNYHENNHKVIFNFYIKPYGYDSQPDNLRYGQEPKRTRLILEYQA